MAHKLVVTKNGKSEIKHLPVTFSRIIIDRQINSYKAAGYSVEFIDGGEWKPICPDCGREMERDGGTPYCEHCEG